MLRQKHEKLHDEHIELNKLAEKRLNDASVAENKFNEKINKLEGELINTRTILQRTKAAGELAMKSIEEEKVKLKADLARAFDDFNGAQKELRMVQIELQKVRNESEQELIEVKGEFEFTIKDQNSQMDVLRERTQEELDTANRRLRKLDETQLALKEAKKSLKDTQTELKHTKESLEERDNEIQIFKLTAENAQDALETMRKEFQDSVDRELDQQREHFQKTEQDLKNAKLNIKELKSQLDESGKQIKLKNE